MQPLAFIVGLTVFLLAGFGVGWALELIQLAVGLALWAIVAGGAVALLYGVALLFRRETWRELMKPGQPPIT